MSAEGRLSIKKRKSAIIFLSISFNICFGYSKEPSHRDGSFEYHNICFSWETRKIIFSDALYLGTWMSACVRLNLSDWMYAQILTWSPKPLGALVYFCVAFSRVLINLESTCFYLYHDPKRKLRYTSALRCNGRGPKVVIDLRSSVFFWPRSFPSKSSKLLRGGII